MNVLLVSAVFYPEPIVIGTLSRDLALMLSKNHKVTVVCPHPSRPYGYVFDKTTLSDMTYNKIILNSYVCPKTNYIGRLRESYSFGKAVDRFIAENYANFDVVYSWSWPLYSQLMIAKAANRYKLPLVTHVQDLYPEPFRRRIPFFGKILYKIFFHVDKRSLQLSDKVVTIAPKIRNYLVETRGLKSSKVDVVYNWQDENRFTCINAKKLKDRKVKDFVFMFLGTLSGAANLEYIAKCFLKANVANAQLIFAGSGSAKANLELIATRDSLSRISFIDAPFDEVAKLQAQADILIISLNRNGAKHAFPSKLPAYMFSSKPIIGSVDIDSDIASVIRESNCGWLVEPDKENDLIALFEKAVSIDSDVLECKGKLGYDYCMQKLSKGVNLKKLCQIIESVAYGE